MILHHFDASPFSEKVRIALGIKGVSWRSVKVPRILPKPNLMPLTGGYRRTPVAQIGRDIYADTRLILAELEARHATPALYPPKQAASIAALEQLGDQVLFLAAIPLLLSEPGRVALENALGAAGLAAFRADRAALFDQGRIGAPTPDFSAAHWHPSMAALEAQRVNDHMVINALTDAVVDVRTEVIQQHSALQELTKSNSFPFPFNTAANTKLATIAEELRKFL